MIGNDDFVLSEKSIARLHAVIKKSADAHATEGELVDGVSVTFSFLPGFGRCVSVNAGGLKEEIEGILDEG
jgi:hypothetical protein